MINYIAYGSSDLIALGVYSPRSHIKAAKLVGLQCSQVNIAPELDLASSVLRVVSPQSPSRQLTFEIVGRSS